MNCKHPLSVTSVFFFTLVIVVAASSQRSAMAQSEKKQEVAGKADVLRHVPKKFATLLSVDSKGHQVTLQFEDENEARTWAVQPDAELKIHGWWGRLAQFKPGDRVWVWLSIDRKRQPQGVLMLADEVSQQDIHRRPPALKSFDAPRRAVTVDSPISGERTLQVADDLDLSEHVGAKVFVQTSGDMARIIATEEQFESMRRRQRERLREQWRARGLPGTVVFLHPLSGEMDLMLDHEAMRWGRGLKKGDEVTLTAADPVHAVVKHVRPWRERTQLRVVTKSGVDQADLSIGQRIGVRVSEPPVEVQASALPADIGRLSSKDERIGWFLASIYCPCKIAGDRCTGMFYTLASCNVNSCAMPNRLRESIGKMIEQRMTDEEIWQAIQERYGPQIVKQHLLHK